MGTGGGAHRRACRPAAPRARRRARPRLLAAPSYATIDRGAVPSSGFWLLASDFFSLEAPLSHIRATALCALLSLSVIGACSKQAAPPAETQPAAGAQPAQASAP